MDGCEAFLTLPCIRPYFWLLLPFLVGNGVQQLRRTTSQTVRSVARLEKQLH